MKRNITVKAKTKGAYLSIDGTIQLKTKSPGMDRDDVSKKVDEIRNQLFNCFRNLGFNAHEIKVD